MPTEDTLINLRWKSAPLNSDLQHDLLERAKAGDSEAFAQLYDDCIERIYRYIFFRVTDEQTAEDLTSQVFFKAWENLDRCKSTGAPFIAWLYTIARNAVIDYYRTRKNTVALDAAATLASDELAPDKRMELQFETESLREALQELTPDQQRVVVLKFISGMSTDEIAQHLGKRPGAVRALQMRALQALAGILQETAR
ncbi:MAG TPA: sigma-70 family RNA polymerase sigma factor [Anaerolineales bacterium]